MNRKWRKITVSLHHPPNLKFSPVLEDLTSLLLMCIKQAQIVVVAKNERNLIFFLVCVRMKVKASVEFAAHLSNVI